MPDLIKTSLGVFTAPGIGFAIQGQAGTHQATVTVQGAASVAASVTIRGSNDQLAWTDIGTASPSGTGVATATVSWSNDYLFWRADVASMTGERLQVSVASDQTGGGSSPGGSGSVAVQDEGTQVAAAAARLNFRGAGVSASSDGAGGVNVDVPGGLRGYLPRVPNMRGGNRIINNFGGVSDGGATQSTSCMKFEFEAPFSAVRVWGFSRWATVTGAFKAVVAPTETMSASPLNDAFQPKLGGAYRNVVQPTHIPNGSNVYSAGTDAFVGWRNVTWAGSTTSPTVSGGAQETPQFFCSDIIPCRSVPRTDVTGVATGRHAAMLRVYNIAGNRPTGDLTTYRARTTETAWFRNFVCGSVNSDAIATIATQPSTAADTAGWTFWIEPIYDVPCRHVVNLGDSRQGEWPRSILQYSTPSAPIAYSELSMPGNHTLAIMQAFDRFITAGSNDCGVTDVILQASSRNFSPLDRKVAQDIQAMLTGYILKMRAAGIRLFLTTDYVDGAATWSAEREAARQSMIAWTRNICAAGLATLVDTDPVVTDYTGATPVIKAGLSADGLHVDDAQETALLSPLMAAAWLAAG